MALNDYVTLGRSGLRVSPFCLGAMTFGLDWGWGSSEEESRRVIDAYADRGGNFIDAANIYTKGHAEAIIGDHVGRDASRRDRLVIATKFLGAMHPGDPNSGGAHRKAIVAACDESLRRLRTGYIDLYWMHFWDRFTPIDETMRTLDDLVRAGKVRYVGFSDTPAWKCVQGQYEAIFRSWTPAVALQIEYSLLERTVEGDLVPMARELGLGITPWGALKGGILTDKHAGGAQPEGRGANARWVETRLADPAVRRVLEVLRAVAAEAGSTPGNVAMAWLQRRPGVSSTIIGARTVAQLEQNLDALGLALSPEQTARLDEASAVKQAFPHEFLKNTPTIVQGGATINGQPSAVWDLAPKTDAERH